MTPERWIQIKEIFALAAGEPVDRRADVVAQGCQGDLILQSELENLLAQCDAMGNFLDGPTLSTAELLVPGDVLCRRYEIVRLLGAGGMGEVYEAADLELGGHVALKLIHGRAGFHDWDLAQFRREVQLARRVTHPNVCRIFDIACDSREQGRITFLTMELLRGETLSARLQRQGRVEMAEARIIASQLCRGLEAAHVAGVLHRDLKSSNVMLVGQGEQLRAVLTDFGIARGLEAANDFQRGNTTSAAALGSPAYASPEQLQRKPLAAATDIYALGVVLFEMVTGTRPFFDRSAWAEALKRLTDYPPAPSHFVPGLERNWNDAILRCLQRDPAQRFSSPAELAEALSNSKSVSSRFRLGWAMGALALALVVLGFVFYSRVWPVSLPAKKYVAVLPFDFAGADAADQAAAYGLAESLSGDLAQLSDSRDSLWVVPWIEVQKHARAGIGRASSSLGVNLVLTGTVEKRHNGLHLHISLKDAATMKQLRFAQWDVPQSERARLEDTLLEHVCSILQLGVRSEMLHYVQVRETATPGAYEYYEQGKGYLARREAQSTDLAIALFQKAIEKDGSFALAYADLALALSWKYHSTRNPQWHAQAEKACTRSLSLSDKLARAHLALGSLALDSGDLEKSIRELERALELEPTNSDAMNLLPRALDGAGRTLQAESLLKEAIQRAPGSWVNYNDLGYFYFRHAQYQQAQGLFQVATELAPDNPLAFSDLGGVYLALGKYTEAKVVLARAIAIKPTAGTYSNLGTSSFRLGEYAEAATMFQKAAELRSSDDRLWRNLGDSYSLSGQAEAASATYTKAIAAANRNLALRPQDGLLLANIAFCDAKLGRNRDAERALALAGPAWRNDPEFLFTSAVIYELVGRRDRALALLSSAIRAGYSSAEIAHTPELSDLRADKRYAALRLPDTTSNFHY